MSCLCKKISCQACNPCDASFEDAFKKLKCTLEVTIGACTKESREVNDTILWMLYDVVCRLRGSICPSDEYILKGTQSQFFDDLVEANGVVISDIVMTNVDPEDLRVWLNGVRIYHEDVQTATGVYVFRYNSGTNTVTLISGPQGFGTEGDPLDTGTVDNPSSIMVEADNPVKFSDLLKCS